MLYLIADFAAFMLHHVVRYRRAVILDNLQKCFPSKTEDEIHKIMAGFYQNLADVSVESLKMLSISPEKLEARLELVGFEEALSFRKKNRSMVCIVAHLSNWEYGAATGFALKQIGDVKPYTIYKRLRNPVFDRLLQDSRKRFGFDLLEMAEVDEFYKTQSRRGLLESSPNFNVFIADQTPSDPRRSHWITFMGRQTPVFGGPELLARRYNLPVIFGAITRIKRGHYRIKLETLVVDSRLTERGEITRMHTNYLENLIYEHPADWLWSHKRWKFEPAAPTGS